MNINCLYKLSETTSKGKLKVIPIQKRGVIIGFSDWPETNLLAIIATEEGEIITVDVANVNLGVR